APNPALTIPTVFGSDRCNPVRVALKPARYRPRLKQAPLTFADRAQYNPLGSAQSAIEERKPDSLLPEIWLRTLPKNNKWTPQRDLLGSNKDAKEFVAEMENDGITFLRFGDDTFGSRPQPDTKFFATYRIGQGLAGNVGCDSLRHVASNDPAVVS